MTEDPAFANVRDFLGGLVGKRLIDVTQHDKEDWENERVSFICLMFEDGNTLTFSTSDESEISIEGPDFPDAPTGSDEPH